MNTFQKINMLKAISLNEKFSKKTQNKNESKYENNKKTKASRNQMKQNKDRGKGTAHPNKQKQKRQVKRERKIKEEPKEEVRGATALHDQNTNLNIFNVECKDNPKIGRNFRLGGSGYMSKEVRHGHHTRGKHFNGHYSVGESNK
jgi:hypothetical protein